MKLSIITINLNNAAGFKKTADSIVNQTYQDFEWIVIDGGSTDGSKELIEQYSDHIAYWVSEKDSGIYNAMNKGVRHACGEYILFLNSGDWFTSESVISKVSAFGFWGDIIYGDVLTVQGDTIIEKKYNDMYLSFLIGATIIHQAIFTKRELLLEYPYNERLHIVSDWEFLLKMYLINKSFRHIDTSISYFDKSGISSNNDDILFMERELVLNQYIPEPIRKDYFDGRIGKLIFLRKRYPIYGKFITATILFMEKIGSHQKLV